MRPVGVTQKQHQLFIFLDQHIKENGFSPSYDEMKEHLGLRSKSGINRLLVGLEERGHICRLPGRPRSISVAVSA